MQAFSARTRQYAFVVGRNLKRLGWFNIPIFGFVTIAIVFSLFNRFDDRSLQGLAERKQKIYVVNQLKFERPPRSVPREIPKPRTRKVPIPDPTPNEPDPMRVEMPVEEEIVLDVQADALMLGVPDAPPPPKPKEIQFYSTGGGGARASGTSSGHPPKQDAMLGEPIKKRAQPSEHDQPLRFVVGGNTTAPRRMAGPLPEMPSAAQAARISGAVVLDCVINSSGTVSTIKVLRGLPLGLSAAAIDAVRQWRFVPATLDGRPIAVRTTITVNFSTEGDDPEIAMTSSSRPPDSPHDGSVARAFFDEWSRLDDLEFQEPHGYWMNTYVPGNWTARRLRLRLREWRQSGFGDSSHDPAPHDKVHPRSQPYDPPRHGALALYAHADRHGIDYRQRLLVELGIKATPRTSGRVTTMHLGIVLDLRSMPSAELAATMRAVVSEFAAARDWGDHFCLVVAGRHGGMVVRPEDFRYGTISLALRDLFDDSSSGESMALTEAYRVAAETVLASDDPSSPLGSSAVLLITAGALGTHPDLTQEIADNAAEGASTNVIAIGESVDLAELDGYVLAGHGQRFTLDDPEQAEHVTSSILAAVSRTVARAVRLNIRLAAGVQLVDVLGSRRVGEQRATQIRAAEKAVDQRLSANLGIASDRGLDEDGIQIVIPSFYAGDEHVILLDLVAPGPGPIVEVNARYKDLIHMRNGVVHTSLELGRSDEGPGPLELNVTKNLLVYEFGAVLEEAATAVTSQRLDSARAKLDQIQKLLRQSADIDPSFAADSELEGLAVIAGEYLGVLADADSWPADRRTLLSDSMRYAAYLLRMHKESIEAPT